MNRARLLESIIRIHGGSTTLGQIIRVCEGEKYFSLRHRFTAAASELRKDLESRDPMETLVWTKGKTPSKGCYSILPARVVDGLVSVEPKQMVFGGTEL